MMPPQGMPQQAPQQAPEQKPVTGNIQAPQEQPMHMMPDGSMMPGPAMPGQKPAQPTADPMQMQQMQAQMLRQGPQGMPPMQGPMG